MWGISNYYIAYIATYETKSNVSLGQQKWKEILVHTVLCINWRQMALFCEYANNFQDFEVRDGRNTKYHWFLDTFFDMLTSLKSSNESYVIL